MSQALSNPGLRNPDACLEGLLDVVHQLAVKYQVTVEHGPVPPRDAMVLDPDTRTIRIRPDTSIEDQTWLLGEAWLLLTIGPHATSAAPRQTMLRILPPPRTAVD